VGGDPSLDSRERSPITSTTASSAAPPIMPPITGQPHGRGSRDTDASDSPALDCTVVTVISPGSTGRYWVVGSYSGSSKSSLPRVGAIAEKPREISGVDGLVARRSTIWIRGAVVVAFLGPNGASGAGHSPTAA